MLVYMGARELALPLSVPSSPLLTASVVDTGGGSPTLCSRAGGSDYMQLGHAPPVSTRTTQNGHAWFWRLGVTEKGPWEDWDVNVIRVCDARFTNNQFKKSWVL